MSDLTIEQAMKRLLEQGIISEKQLDAPPEEIIRVLGDAYIMHKQYLGALAILNRSEPVDTSGVKGRTGGSTDE